ncbi:MAG: D-alanyl-D-alanine carboxypeptidase family protein [Mariprofundaceae bacterium]
MKNRLCVHVFSLYLWIVLLLLVPFHVGAMDWPSGPEIQAKSWVLIDGNSEQVLAEKNANEEMPPASLTKLMTLYIAFEEVKLGRIELDEHVEVSQRAWKIGGSRMFIEPRMQPTVRELLHGISTVSGNDASIAMAEYISGTEDAFAVRMNNKAVALGMKHSHFLNATGFPKDGHYSSAMDIALLSMSLWRDFPEQSKLFSEHEFSYNGITQSNRNRLLWRYKHVDGMKTGHTEAAGYCLATSAKKGDMRLISAVFGADSKRAREDETKRLLKFGFRNFVSMHPTQRDIRRQVEVYQGKSSDLWLIPQRSFRISVPKGLEQGVKFRLRYSSPLFAPISKGDAIGSIDAVLGKSKDAEVLYTIPMVAADSVEQASWLGQRWDTLRLWWMEE